MDNHNETQENLKTKRKTPSTKNDKICSKQATQICKSPTATSKENKWN